jgi:hypothetical protein
LVRHLLRSGRPGAIERAARVAVGANADLLAAGAPEISRSLLTAVIEAMDAAELDAPVERASTLAALASTSMALLDVPRAREQLRTAARIAIALNSPEVLKPVQATFIAPTLVGGVDDEMIGLVQRLLDLAPAGTPLRVLLLCWLGMELGWTYDDRRLKAVVDEALDTARVLRDPGIFLLAANAWHFLSRFVHPAVRRDLVDEVLEVSDRLGEPLGLQFLMYRTVDSLELGDHHAAAEAVRDAKARVAASHWSYEPWVVRRTEVMFATLEGRLDEADRLGDGFAAMTPPDGAPDAQLQLVVQTLVRRYHQGRLEELHPLVAAFAADEKAPDFARCVLAWIEVEIGAASASVALDAALAAARAAPRDLTWKLVLAITAEAAAGLGRPAADEIARMLEPWSSLHVITTTLTYLGAIDRYLALGAAAAGDLDRAVSLGERALDQHRGVGSPPYVARTAAELAAMLRRRGEPSDHDRADLLRAEARELAHHHGLQRVLALTR